MISLSGECQHTERAVDVSAILKASTLLLVLVLLVILVDGHRDSVGDGNCGHDGYAGGGGGGGGGGSDGGRFRGGGGGRCRRRDGK